VGPLEVSELALGSWRTYEHLSREEGVAVLRAARESGIAFLDDARYNDETGTAPIPTGYSEVVFGELFRASGWPRDEVVVANKLWWEFWPEETAAQELDASLERMGFDHLDLVYAAEPPERLDLEELVASVTGLIAAGKVRAWGVLNWPPELVTAAVELAATPPCAAQVPYNLLLRDHAAAVDERVAVIASAPLWFGALTGRRGRRTAGSEDPSVLRAFAVADELAALAAEVDATPAQLALAFCLADDRVGSVLFGASSPEQVRENAGAVALLGRLGADELERLRAAGA
jgi:aryl-alcohol dehydrogenase-like predicted oxidoreductase